MPCSRTRSWTLTPDKLSFRIFIICSSVNLLFKGCLLSRNLDPILTLLLAQFTGKRSNYEYERSDICTIIMAKEPLTGKQYVQFIDNRTKKDFTKFVSYIPGLNPNAERITLVMENMTSHKPGSLYETPVLERVKQIWDRFEFVHTP